MRVLVASTNPRLTADIRSLLIGAGAICDTVDTGQDLEFAVDHDCLVLDLDGIDHDTLRRVRAAKPALQIVTLSRHSRAIHAFAAGADDFLGKPFRGAELVARIRTRVRRVHGHSTRTIEIGRLKIDLDERVAYLAGTPIHLTRHEYDIVEVLAMRRGRVVTKEQLLSHMYQVDDEPNAKIIDVFICKIRKKLGAGFIETAWGRGYIIRELVITPAAVAA
jgi:two-component system cell cycle response regulator CtrA